MKNAALFLLFVCLSASPVLAQWNLQPTGVASDFFGVWFTSPAKGWVIGKSGTFMQTTDGGKTWTQAQGLSSRQTNLNKIMFTDSTHGRIVGDYNAVFSTTDGGQSWSQSGYGAPYSSNYYGIFDLQRDGRNSIWVSGGRNTNAFTDIEKMDSTGYLHPQIMGFAGRLVRLYFYNDRLGWAVGDSGLILSTTNGGTWWNEQQSHTKLGLNDIAFFNPDTGICCGTDGLIFRTTDGGANWNEIDSTLGVILFRLVRVGDSAAYIVGTGNTILKSTDEGATWTHQSDNAASTTDFEDVFFLNDSTAWAVGHDGIIVHMSGDTSNPAPVTAVKSGNSAHSFKLQQNYPNPFNPSTVISYAIPNSGFVTLTVYNSIGQKVRTLVSGQQSSGEHSVEFDAGTLSSGVYFYRLHAGNYTKTKKLAVLK